MSRIQNKKYTPVLSIVIFCRYIAGVRDRSGIRLMHTKQATPRQFGVGIFQIGDGQVLSKRWLEVPTGLSRFRYRCNGLRGLKDGTTGGLKNITLLSHTHHMHKHGAQMTTDIYRKGKVVEHLRTEHYSFEAQDQIYKEFVVQPDDTFEVECRFKVNGDTPVQFGFGSNEEMCIDFVLYYPVEALHRRDAYCGSLMDESHMDHLEYVYLHLHVYKSESASECVRVDSVS